MKKKAVKVFEVIIFFTFSIAALNAQDNTVGLINKTSEVYEGYTLFSPASNTSVYLIDTDGRIVNQWESEHRVGHAVYLQEDGSLYRENKADGGGIEKFNWDGDLLWSYFNSNEKAKAHHDFQVLPNGNILLLLWEEYDKEQSIANGRNPESLTEDKLWPEMVLEIEPTGSEGANVVWEWHSWDHMVQDFDDTKLNYAVIADNPGKIDLNYFEGDKTGADWQHANSLSYNADLDQIMISVLNFDEIWIIDHNTTIEEAKGDRGDLLYRWGNPVTYGAGTTDDAQLFGQHNAYWIEEDLPDAGKIMIFNNGRDRPAGAYSSVVKISPIILGDGSYEKANNDSFLPATFDFEYTAEVPTDFYSWYISGAQQLPNGNILIDDGAHGTFFEITASGSEVWRYVSPVSASGILEQGEEPINIATGNPNNGVFRATKYGLDFEGFIGRDLTPEDYIETYPILAVDDTYSITKSIFPNPASDVLNIHTTTFNNHVQLLNMSGQIVLDKIFNTDVIQLKVEHLSRGIYQAIINNRSVGKIALTN
jgi:Arylsulfotransferase (ASST)/Secretion system C-terminal sorting domain